jgi:NADH-quinone oxidoreductase subunit J
MDLAVFLPAVAFYVFAGAAIAFAFGVVAARNPVRSVLFLIMTFFSAAGLFVLMGAEFLAMILIMVYVGAVAVLFLFVVMMLDIDYVELRQGFADYLPLGGLLAFVLTVELVVLGASWHVSDKAESLRQVPISGDTDNLRALSNVLYTDYAFFLEAAGLVLLVAMIGAIVLTNFHKKGVKRQNISAQVARKAKDGVELVDVKPGQGI